MARESVIYRADSDEPQPPWEVASGLRWLIVREVLIDPISWLLLAVSCWFLLRVATPLASPGTWGCVLVPAAALCTATVVAMLTADRLLFSERDNEVLRVQPLGEDGFYKVRSRELHWWAWPPALLAAAAGLSVGSWTVAAATLAGSLATGGIGIGGALLLRGWFGARRGLVAATLVGVPLAGLWLGSASPLPRPDLGPWLAIAPGLLWLLLGTAAVPISLRMFRHSFERLASDAAVRDRSEPGRMWHLMMALVPAPLTLRARLTRDLVLLTRGWDPRGALLIALSPLSCLYLADLLEQSIREAPMTWRVLEAAALGAAAIAYAVGPNIHVLRNEAMAWSRTSPRPGRNSLRGALAYGLLFAIAHGGLVLLTVALVRDGRYLDRVADLTFPVLALEAGMVHFAVVYSMAESLGRRVAGEGALILALACIAAGLAVVGYLYPLALPLYLVLMVGLVAQAVQRYESLEVTW